MLLSFLSALLLDVPAGSSVWAIIIIWAVRIVSLSLLFRTLVGPSIVRIVSKRLRIQSISLRSIKGVYFRTGSGTWRVERIGLSYHRRSPATASRFSVVVQGLKLELAHGEKETSLGPSLSRKRMDLPPSRLISMMHLSGALIWSTIHSAYNLLDPYLRPALRTFLVAALRLAIRALPALTHVVDFELDSAVVTLSALPGLELAVKQAKLHTKVSLLSLASEVVPAGTARFDHRRHKRLNSVADWNARLTNSLRRTWDRAWGATQVTASVSLRVKCITGSVPPDLLKDLPPEPARESFIKVPKTHFTASVRIDPHRAIEPHSVELSLGVDSVQVQTDVVQQLLKILKLSKAGHVSSDSSRESPVVITPATPPAFNKRRSTWSSPMSPGSPFMEALSSEAQIHRTGYQATNVRFRVYRFVLLLTVTQLRLSTLKSVDVRIVTLTLRHCPARLEKDVAQTFEATLRDLHLNAGLSHPDTNAVHRAWLGSKSVSNDGSSADVYRADISTSLFSLDQSGYGAVIDHLRVISAGPIQLNTLVSQWPSPWLSCSSFLCGDPNSQLLGIHVDLGDVQITQRLEVFHALLAREKPQRQDADKPPLPTVISSVPRIVFGFKVGPIVARLISPTSYSDKGPFALEARTDGIVASAHSHYRSLPDRHIGSTNYDHTTVQMDVDFACTLHSTFVVVCYGSNMNGRHSIEQSPEFTTYPGDRILSLDAVELFGHGSAIGEMADTAGSSITLDLLSFFTDVQCSSDVLSIELWQPDVIKAIARVVNLSERAVKTSTPSTPRYALDQLPFGVSAAIAIGRLIVFVTAPDLAPNEDLGISRGIALHTCVAASYCAVHGRHTERMSNLLPRGQKRLRLSLPTEAILKAVSGTTVPAATPNNRVLVGLSLRRTVVRDTVATQFAADDSYSAEDGSADSPPNEFLRINDVEIDVILCGTRQSTFYVPGIKDDLLVNVSVTQIRGSLRLVHLYHALLAARTLKSLFPSHVKPYREEPLPSTLSLNVQCDVKDVQLLCELPMSSNVFIRISYLRCQNRPENRVNVKWDNIIMAVAVKTTRDGVHEEEWEELAHLSDWHITVPLLEDPLTILVEGDSGLLRIPFDFVLADLILSINLTIKSAKHLARMVTLGRFEEPPAPEPEEAKIAPNISCKIRSLIVEAAEEAMESKLGIIWRTGFEAARVRQEREEAFQAKVATISKTDTAQPTSKPHGIDSDFHFTSKHTVSIRDARERLSQVHSVAWRSAFLKARASQIARERRYFHQTAGARFHGDASDSLVTVKPPTAYPPLFRLVLDSLSLNLSAPAPLVERVPHFLHDVGNGLPKDTQFSLLIPLHINFTLASLRFTYREYPLPLLCVPRCTADDSAALVFDSDLVIAEEMGSDASVEWFPSEIVEVNSGVHGASPLFIHVPKTIMPVKTYALPTLRVLTDNTTDFAWGVSYGPATQDLMRVIDTLSHAPRDPSPPIGFWDKLRLVFHWRIDVSFQHDVHFHMKGSRDPHELGGTGAGFALCWQGNPRLLIGQPNEQQELVQLVSNSMLIIIPNVQDTWGTNVHLPSASAAPFFTYSSRQSRDFKVCAKLSSGVRFGVGCVLEHSCGPECPKCSGKPFDRDCRFFDFRPHYSVKPENKQRRPEYKAIDDSYNGFRSDFIHLSISLTSALYRDKDLSTQKASSVHLSPELFEHFWAWWSLFDGTLSLPIRQGSYYSHKRPLSPKLGQHLATLKYRISIAQLFLSHVYVDNSKDAWADGVTPFVGIKALIDHFQADMHQRDQETAHVTEGNTQSAHHKAFYAVEVVMKSLDLRSMLAVFPEPLKQQVHTESAPLMSNYRTQIKTDPVPADSVWIDYDDFDDTRWSPSTSPTVHLLSAAFCPHFTYFKRTRETLLDVSPTQLVKSKFGTEDTHVCSLGKELSVTQIQIALAGLRIKKLQRRLSQCLGSTGRHDGARDADPSLDSPGSVDGNASDLRKKIKLLNNYVSHLHKEDSAANASTSHGIRSYDMPTDAVSADEWAEFDNVYQVHSPQVFLDHVVRDIMMQYYYCSRTKRSVEYHMAARAVKFIRDQAKTALADLLQEPGQTRGPVSSAQAAAIAVRNFLGRDGMSDTIVDTTEDSVWDNAKPIDPLNGWTEGVTLRRSHFCLLLKPQIVLRREGTSDPDPESVCVLTAVQGKLKSFAILDEANVDDPVIGKIMNRHVLAFEQSRNFASITGLQTFSPSVTNQSGKGSVPLEVLIDLRCENSAFDRLVPQTDASFQYDKFNRLRLRNKITTIARTSQDSNDQHDHLQDQTDLIRLHIPRFTVSANDGHFQAISNIVTKLVLFSDAALKERSDKLERLLFKYDFTNMGLAADVVLNMQARLRHALEIRRQAMQTLQGSGDEGQVEIYKVDAHILMLAEELNLIFDAIQLSQDKANEHPEKKSALLLHASSSEISWRMLDHQDQLLAKLAVRNIHFYWLSQQDSSTVNNLVVGDLQAYDGSANAQWTEILSKSDEPATHPLVKKKLFVVADWTVLPPVGGITIYENFEITFHPMRLQIDTRVGKKIMEYIWPARKHRSNSEEVQSFEPLLDSTTEEGESNIVVVPESPDDVHRSSWDVSPRKSVDSNRLAASPMRKLGASRSVTDLRNTRSETLKAPRLHRTKSTDALVTVSTPSRSFTNQTIKNGSDSRDKSASSRNKQEVDDATEMKTRSSQKTFVRVRVNSLHLLLSIAKEDSFLCRDARIRTRDLEYRNQTSSFEELVDQFIPSGRNWRGWIKMAFQQPLVPVLPVARELISKTKWIQPRVHHTQTAEDHQRSSTPTLLLPFQARTSSTNSATSSDSTATGSRSSTIDLRRHRAKSPFPLHKNPTPVISPDFTAEPEPLPDANADNSSMRRIARPRVLSVFRRRHGNPARSSIDSDASANSVSQHIMSMTRTSRAGPSSSRMMSEDDREPFLASGATEGRPRRRHTLSDMGYGRVEDDMISLNGLQTEVLIPRDDEGRGRVGSALSLPRSDTSCYDEVWDGEHHSDDIVEHLDVIDPQIATVATLTNAANSIVIPPLDFYSHKPVVVLPRRRQRRRGDAEKAEPAGDQDSLDMHVEDVLRKRDRFRRVMRGVWSFMKTRMSCNRIRCTVVTVFWGSALVLFLARFINVHNDNTQNFWIELCQQILTGFFSLPSIGLMPFRIVDTYRICKICYYQRKTAKLRQKAGLPALYDKNDLPDPKYDANYVPVLSDEEQVDLHYQQLKFMQAQTWYRPHGTQTHRAFPIDVALWICIMNDLNSVFQCLLSGCMWSMDRFIRPAWTTATTLPLSFLAGIVAGFLIYWGGRKTKRVKEVTERLRMALAMEDSPSDADPECPTIATAGEGASMPDAPLICQSTQTLPDQQMVQCIDYAEETIKNDNVERDQIVGMPSTRLTPMFPDIRIVDEMSVPPAELLSEDGVTR
ncbi:uncharacterized protein LAESUDRAFT_638973 [Laetiporus sulphureus 93-53]|uniref:Golgi-body localization protein domain-containing protein n=1 Tax=Laetiporus sulphureus 93-53 TaxID=1314785 RepID=A0A165I2K6_9APHY|nr:uncharacterized protein LAESUDRAFT_638973 [Laetiporus sulphureus 93-53]KZT12507.1 hypothetical protein LAESUDRAFT_638973 [Laetiporus sulphureus 93-53]